MTIRVEPATAPRWTDVVTAFGPRAAKQDSCWCQRFRDHDEPTNLAALRLEVEASAIQVGLLAYVDDQTAAWTRVVPRHTLAGVRGNQALQRILVDDESAWWVTCINTRRENRGIYSSRPVMRLNIR